MAQVLISLFTLACVFFSAAMGIRSVASESESTARQKKAFSALVLLFAVALGGAAVGISIARNFMTPQ